MIKHGTVRCTVKPEEKTIDDYSVWIASDIKEVTEDPAGNQEGFKGWEYTLVQYDKDEYIKLIDEKNASLEQQATEAQIALCDLYEMIGGDK